MGVLWKMTQLRVCKSVLVFQANKTNTTHAESWCYHVTLLLNAVILLSQTQGKRFPSTCSFLFVVNMAMHRLKRQWRWLQCSILAQKEHAQFCPTCYEWCANITDWWHSGSPHPTSSPWVSAVPSVPHGAMLLCLRWGGYGWCSTLHSKCPKVASGFSAAPASSKMEGKT